MFKKLKAFCTNQNKNYNDNYYQEIYLKREHSFYGFIVRSYYRYLAWYVFAKPALLKKGDKILDIGCGGGILVEQFNKLGYDAMGVDVNVAAIRNSVFSQKCFLVKTTAKLNYPDKRFNLVTSREVLEHIPLEYLDDCIKEWDRVSRGTMIHIVAVKERGASATEDPLHINIQNEDWWLAKFKEHGFSGIKRPQKLFFSLLGNSGYFMFIKKIN